MQLAVSDPVTRKSRTAIFEGTFDSLVLIAGFVRAAAEEAGLDACSIYAVETSVDEACSNIIEHAYGAEKQGDITCTCEISAEGLTVILKDHGQPFNPEAIRPPNVKAKLKKRDNHGLGLYIMYKWMDEVHFEFHEGENILTMIKRKESCA